MPVRARTAGLVPYVHFGINLPEREGDSDEFMRLPNTIAKSSSAPEPTKSHKAGPWPTCCVRRAIRTGPKSFCRGCRIAAEHSKAEARLPR